MKIKLFEYSFSKSIQKKDQEEEKKEDEEPPKYPSFGSDLKGDQCPVKKVLKSERKLQRKKEKKVLKVFKKAYSSNIEIEPEQNE